jgi:hypothetical protein
MASTSYQQWWEHFVQTGDICPLRLGASRQEVEALFGPPDDFSADATAPATAFIWKYAGVEFHFGTRPESHLWLIYMDAPNGVLLSIGGHYGRRPHGLERHE